MARGKARSILRRQLDARKKLWPDLSSDMLWSMDNEGWVALPRLMPLMMSIMDDLAGKGVPVSRTYLELWSRIRIEESFIALNRPEEMAFHAGFEGQRALRTWKDRMHRLANLRFIGVMPGPLGELSFAVIYNPYHVIKRAYLAKQVHENKWQALAIRANEVSAFDLDDIDDHGNLVADDDDDEDEDDAPAAPAAKLKSAPAKPHAPVKRNPTPIPRRGKSTGK
ncbi:hypothetical protein N2599_18480 [Rhizobium sullae]|uniref:Uncharacterized protein n=1 Tax=Rhizobium sullae TaxID=50338 RepID=A0ABY5XI30_RHISU|nr:hypothetical protein [Rhizobium sullae]UWU14077.1 hypothetical protein N2599_18480 [Rhizobium sullae]